MNTQKTVIFGSDCRFEYTEEYLRAQGFEVCRFSKELLSYLNSDEREPAVFILPLPFSRDKIRLNCSDADGRMFLDEFLSLLKKGDKVAGGLLTDSFRQAVCSVGATGYDYYDGKMIEDNAVLTAKAVLMLFDELKLDYKAEKIAVTGFGRTAKAIAKLLEAENADFTITARSETAQTQAGSRNCRFVKLKSFTGELSFFDIIINTVPALIFDEGMLSRIKKDAVIIDIASAPYGISDCLAEQYKLRLVRALSLPGRYLPDEAGRLIGRRIELILKGGS